ncbi:MAG: hypothetical protein LBC93_07235 [Synergistaceae bacterium]|nr:hypothetical protein [Synergistaceae bacterium]
MPLDSKNVILLSLLYVYTEEKLWAPAPQVKKETVCFFDESKYNGVEISPQGIKKYHGNGETPKSERIVIEHVNAWSRSSTTK